MPVTAHGSQKTVSLNMLITSMAYGNCAPEGSTVRYDTQESRVALLQAKRRCTVTVQIGNER